MKKCPQCGHTVEEITDDLGRRWYKCTGCDAQFPMDWPDRVYWPKVLQVTKDA